MSAGRKYAEAIGVTPSKSKTSNNSPGVISVHFRPSRELKSGDRIGSPGASKLGTGTSGNAERSSSMLTDNLSAVHPKLRGAEQARSRGSSIRRSQRRRRCAAPRKRTPTKLLGRTSPRSDSEAQMSGPSDRIQKPKPPNGPVLAYSRVTPRPFPSQNRWRVLLSKGNEI